MTRLAIAAMGTLIVPVAFAVRNDETAMRVAPVLQPVVAATHPWAHRAPGADPRSVGNARSFTLVVRTYCVICHNDQLLTAGLSLAAFDVDAATGNPEIAEKVIRKLRAGMMPPAGMPRPANDTLGLLATTLEVQLDAAAAKHPNPGRRTFQRLNRDEYARSIRDLLDIEVDISAFLPPETMSHNFDNIADVQMLSPALMEGYLRAAGQIARDAVGDPDAGTREANYKVPKTASQMERVEGAPFGTRGGISVVHNFPADGDYIFKIALHPGPTGFLFGMTARDEQLEISINGERAALVDIDRWMSESDPNGMNTQTAPIHVRAGPQRVTAAFIRRFDGPVEDIIAPIEHTLADSQIGSAYGITTLPHLRDLAIAGPLRVTGVSESPPRRKIFSCRPLAPSDELRCAQEIVTRLAAQAYRRPLTEHDVRGLMSFYESAAAEAGFEAGIRTALQAILASPHFVFRLEEVPAGTKPGAVYRISDVDLASRLSFFLWSSGPDEELVALAGRGELRKRAVLEAQVRRMLADPRALSLATRFAAQWLRLQDLEKIHPDALLYPQYDARLAGAMRRETELLFDHLVRSDGDVLELLTADYTFVNERLARHYGIPNVTGEAFRRVQITDENRRGLLGHGSVLTLTSHADRTSPVLRGKWVMEVFLNSPPPPPPPNVPDLEATEGIAEGRLLTVRERMEQHRANPMCQSCHQMMDPIGLALEYFDVTGAWRLKDAGMPIDAAGQLYDGTPLNGPVDLRNALLERPEAFLRTFVTNLMAYGLGRRVEYYDMPTVRSVVRTASAQGNRFSAMILGVVRSPAFTTSVAESVAAGSTN
ncbi:MAG: DUF1592 domain-containing protein [Gemmatimonadetes bacterium]|nr:DUF1592 domain-containing protein [Gemmatimonadota bacterium]